MLCLWSGPPGFNCWMFVCFLAPVFSCMCCWVIISVSSPFISWFIFTRRWCFEKLGIFHANQPQPSICLDLHKKEVRSRYRLTCLSAPVMFQRTVPMRCFFCVHFCPLCFVFVFVILSFLFLHPCGHLLGKGWLFGSLGCGIFFVYLSLSHMVPWVRCGTYLYRFLIFAAFLSL